MNFISSHLETNFFQHGWLIADDKYEASQSNRAQINIEKIYKIDKK